MISNPTPLYIENIIIQKDTCTPSVIEALFKIARSWKQPKCLLTEESIKKKWLIYIYTHTDTLEYYSAIGKNQVPPFATTCNGSRNGHTEWSKSDTERQISYDVTSMWNLKKGCKWTYLQNRSRVTNIQKHHRNQNALCHPS